MEREIKWTKDPKSNTPGLELRPMYSWWGLTHSRIVPMRTSDASLQLGSDFFGLWVCHGQRLFIMKCDWLIVYNWKII